MTKIAVRVQLWPLKKYIKLSGLQMVTEAGFIALASRPPACSKLLVISGTGGIGHSPPPAHQIMAANKGFVFLISGFFGYCFLFFYFLTYYHNNPHQG